MPNSNYSCYQRAHLITPEEYQVFMIWQDKLEGVRLKWYKHYNEMKESLKHMQNLFVLLKTLSKLLRYGLKLRMLGIKLQAQAQHWLYLLYRRV